MTKVPVLTPKDSGPAPETTGPRLSYFADLLGSLAVGGSPGLPGDADFRSRDRIRRVRLAAGTSLASKALQVLSQTAFVALAVRHLGPEKYGLWMAICAGAAFGSVASIGVVPAFINGLAEAHGRDDRTAERQLFTSCFAFLLAVTVVLAGACLAVFPFVPWARSLNAPPSLIGEVTTAVAVYASIWLLQLPLSLVDATYTALQEAHIAYVWRIAGQIVSIAALALAAAVGAGLPGVILAYHGSAVAVATVNGAWLVFRLHRYLVPSLTALSGNLVRRLVGSGLHFLLVGVASLVLAQFVTIAIVRKLGPAAVTPYEVTLRLVALTGGLWAMVYIPLWGAYGEARGRGDLDWLWRTHTRTARWSLLTSLGVFGTLALAGRAVIRLWAGPDAVPPTVLLWLACAYGVVSVSNLVHGTLLNGLDKIKWQAMAGVLNAAVAIPLVLVLMPTWGITGAAAGLLLATAATTGWLLPWKAHIERREMIAA